MEHFTTDGDLDLDLIERYFSGALGAAERETFERWMSVHPMRRRSVEDLRGVWTRAGRGEGWDVDGIWQALVARMRVADSSDVTHLALNTRSISGGLPAHETSARSDRRWGGVWGTQTLRGWVWPIAFGLAVSALVINLGHTGWASRDRSNVTAMTTYATNAGQQANITLPDGSHVLLNVASQLQVPVDFAHGHRILLLSGEALFTVEHHAGGPFTVVASGTTTRALGTTFLVRRYATDTATMVVVQTGKIAVRSLVLAAGWQMEVAQSGMVHVQPADASQFSFTIGVLTLEDVPLPTAIPALDRWYDADIRLGSPSLAGRRIDGRLTAGSLTDLTALLALTFHVRVVRDGRVLTLFPR